MDFFEKTNQQINDPKLVASWYLTEVKSLGASAKGNLSTNQFVELLDFVKQKKISRKMGKEILKSIWGTSKKPADVIKEQGLSQVTDVGQIRAIVQKVLSQNADKVTEYKSGKTKLLGFFVGQI